MVRFFHTSDWHLGRQLYGASLIEDQSACLDHLLELLDRHRPHGLLISGDVYDRPLPPEAAVALFGRFLHAVARDRKIPVFIIPGNHDSCERLGFASGLLREQGVVIFDKVQASFQPVRIKGDDGAEALVYGIPFVEPFEIAHALGEPELDTPDAAIRALCRRLVAAREVEPMPSVLLCHALVIGGEASESEREIFIGGASAVDVSAFDGFSYTALGHLHKPQRAGSSENVRYSGSLFPYSKSEHAQTKAFTEVRVARDGGVETVAHPIRLKRRLRYLEGHLESLLQGRENVSADDYVIAGLTDSGAVVDAFAKLLRVYPRLLHVSRAGGFTPDKLPAAARLRERENVSDLDLFAGFFSEITGEPLSDLERAGLIESLKETEEAAR